MKKTHIKHGLWATVTVAAFYGGSMQHEISVPERAAQASGAATKVSDSVSASGGRENAGRSPAGAVRMAFGLSALDRIGWDGLAKQAVTDPNPVTRFLAFSQLLKTMTAENAQAIREQLVALGATGDTWRDFNYRWGALAGEEVVLFAMESPEPDLDAALSGWASANPDAAMAFLDNLPENMRADRERYAASIVAGLADGNPTVAANFVMQLASEGSGQGPNLMEMVANKAIRVNGFLGAAAWSESLPDGELKAAAMNRVGSAYARRDPEGAAGWIERFAERDYAARAVEEVSDGWARRDPVAAVDWLQTLPEGKGQTSGLNSVFGDWEDSDPLKASEYLLGMSDSPQRDSAISGFSRTL